MPRGGLSPRGHAACGFQVICGGLHRGFHLTKKSNRGETAVILDRKTPVLLETPQRFKFDWGSSRRAKLEGGRVSTEIGRVRGPQTPRDECALRRDRGEGK